MSDQEFHTCIRSQIRPFPRTAMYPTRWAGKQTFEQIYDNLAHYASNIMKNYGSRPHEMPDSVQIGFIVLWETAQTPKSHFAKLAA